MSGMSMNNNLPLITVITATYNLIKNGRKEFFKQCLESVHNQTYPNIEHLIIDGASSDGTVEMLQEYAGKGWIKYISEPDSGIYDAMNKGILKATGEYVAFLNSDDFYYDKQAIHYLVTAAQKEQADACYASTKVLSETDDSFLYDWSGKNSLCPPLGDIPNHQTFLTKTQVMKELGLFDLKYKLSADSNFVYKMIKQHKKLLFIDKYIIGFRKGGVSTRYQSKVFEDMQQSFLDIFGNEVKLTSEELKKLWHDNLHKLSLHEALQLGSKLQKPEWIEEYYRRIFQIQLDKQALKLAQPNYKYFLFNFIPIMQAQNKGARQIYKLFNLIPLMSAKIKTNRKQYYLFGFIPLLKIKKSKK